MNRKDFSDMYGLAIHNVPDDITWQDVKELFDADYVHSKIWNGIANAFYRTSQSMIEAYTKFQGYVLNEQKLKVQIDRKHFEYAIFVSNIPMLTAEEAIIRRFYNEGMLCHLPFKEHDGSKSVIILYACASQMYQSIEMNNSTSFNGHTLSVRVHKNSSFRDPNSSSSKANIAEKRFNRRSTPYNKSHRRSKQCLDDDLQEYMNKREVTIDESTDK